MSFVAAGAFATGTSPVVPVPAGYAAGDVFFVFYTGQVATTAPAGWTALIEQGTGRFLSVYYRKATSSESSVTFTTATDATVRAVMVAYRGVASFTPTAVSSIRTGSSTTAQTPSFAHNSPGGEYPWMISAFVTDDTNANSFTTPASTTLRASANTTTAINGMLIVDATTPFTTYASISSTLSSTNPWATVVIGLYPQRDCYWVGGTGNWTDASKWSISSGGPGGYGAPSGFNTFNSDTTTIDSNSGTGTITATVTNTVIYAPVFTVSATQALNLNIVFGAGTFGEFNAYSNATFPSSGSFTITASGYLTPNNNNPRGGIVVSGTLTANNTVLPVLNVAGTCTLGSNLTVNGPIYHIYGTFDTSSSGNYTVSATQYFSNNNSSSKTLNLNASTVNLSRNYVSSFEEAPFYVTFSGGYTLNAGTSTVNFTGTSPYIFSTGVGPLTFYNIAFTNTAITNIFINSSSMTVNNLTVTSRASDGIILLNPANTTVNGTLTLGSANSPTKRIFVQGGGSLSAASIAALSDVDFRFVTAAGASSPWSGTRLGNALNNTNITFDAGKTVYWNLAGTQNWSSTGWATTNNGTPAANNFPLAQDTAVFTEAGAAGTITWDADWNVGTIQMADGVSNRTTAFTIDGTNTVSSYGSINFFSGLNYSNTGSINFRGSGVTQNINFAGKTIGSFSVSASGGSVILQNDIISSGSGSLSSGTFNANGYDVTCTAFFGSGSTTKTLTMGSGTWTLSGTGTVWDLGANLTFNVNTANIALSDTSTTSRTFAGGGLTYNNLNIGGTTGTSVLTISGANTFNTLSSSKTVAHTVEFAANQTIVNWSISGSAGNLVTVDSSVAGTQRNIVITNKTTSIDYLAVQDINGTNINPITFWVGANSTNNNNNNNVAFADGATNEAYVITSGTSWTAPAGFNAANNFIYLIGAGGGGAGSAHATTIYRAGGAGGGGGAYTRLTNAPLTPSTSYTIAIGAGGTSGIGNTGTTAASGGGAGGQTTLTIGGTTYRANGGSGGTATAGPSFAGSTGGAGGLAQSITGILTAAFAGGTGGAGSTSSTNTFHSSGGGGAGAGGPNGIGGNGGTGSGGSNISAIAGGGGGGNGGGTAGGNAVSGTSGAGGNNSFGIGGAPATPSSGTPTSGFSGGGGSGGTGNGSRLPGSGGAGADILGAVGGGGGSGGRSYSQNNTASAGLYGGGGGGAGGIGGSSPVVYNGGAGAQGVIIVTWTIAAGATSNYFLLF